jgi:polysaccharide export outer membrane protein
LLALGTWAIFLSGCASEETEDAGPLATRPIVSVGPKPRYVHELPELTSAIELYRVGPRDRIQLFVARHPEFEGELLVDARGRITLPTAEMEISVSGLNAIQIARKLAMEIRPYVIRSPLVRVEILEANSKCYYVVGGVNRPGRYRIGKVPVSIKDALLSAGLPDGGAEIKSIELIKADPIKPESVRLDASAIMKGDLGIDVTLRDGDIIFVPTKTYSKVNRLQVDLEMHLKNGASTESLHRFVRENFLGKAVIR